MNATYVMTGTLKDGVQLLLDEAPPVPDGKVQVTVELLDPMPPKQSLNEWLESARQRRTSAGVQPLTDQQIEEWVDQVRTGRGN